MRSENKQNVKKCSEYITNMQKQIRVWPNDLQNMKKDKNYDYEKTIFQFWLGNFDFTKQ